MHNVIFHCSERFSQRLSSLSLKSPVCQHCKTTPHCSEQNFDPLAAFSTTGCSSSRPAVPETRTIESNTKSIGRPVSQTLSNIRSTLHYLDNLTAPMGTRLPYAIRCKAAMKVYKLHGVITDVIRLGSTIRDGHLVETQHRRTLC